MARIYSHADMAPFVCDHCCMPCEDAIEVVTEAGYGGDRDQPAYDATVEQWCAACVKCGGYLAKVDENRDEPYERAAARARSNDFADTGGKDWT